MQRLLIATAMTIGLTVVASADIFHNYENLGEGFLGTTMTMGGVTYRDVNNVAGIYADGTPFTLGELGSELIIEDASIFYNDFPTWGSPNKTLTFGDTFIPGGNLSIGVLASVFMDIDQLSTAASLDIAFYENGPWGGVVYHLDGLLNGQVVASTTYTLSDLGGRDNAAVQTLSIGGANFNGLHLYATKDGQFSAPRGMIDNLSITTAPVPEPATMAALGIGALALLRRRRKS